MLKFNNGSLNSAFVTRIFEEHPTVQGKLVKFRWDFKIVDGTDMMQTYESFLEFMVALTYKRAEASVNFFWRILDIDKRGYITIANLNFFCRVREYTIVDGRTEADRKSWENRKTLVSWRATL